MTCSYQPSSEAFIQWVTPIQSKIQANRQRQHNQLMLNNYSFTKRINAVSKKTFCQHPALSPRDAN